MHRKHNLIYGKWTQAEWDALPGRDENLAAYLANLAVIDAFNRNKRRIEWQHQYQRFSPVAASIRTQVPVSTEC